MQHYSQQFASSQFGDMASSIADMSVCTAERFEYDDLLADLECSTIGASQTNLEVDIATIQTAIGSGNDLNQEPMKLDEVAPNADVPTLTVSKPENIKRVKFDWSDSIDCEINHTSEVKQISANSTNSYGRAAPSQYIYPEFRKPGMSILHSSAQELYFHDDNHKFGGHAEKSISVKHSENTVHLKACMSQYLLPGL